MRKWTNLPGWHEPRPRPETPAPRHREAAIKGHMDAGRRGGDKGHPGKPAKVETRAAARPSENQEAVLLFLELVDDI